MPSVDYQKRLAFRENSTMTELRSAQKGSIVQFYFHFFSPISIVDKHNNERRTMVQICSILVLDCSFLGRNNGRALRLYNLVIKGVIINCAGWSSWMCLHFC